MRPSVRRVAVAGLGACLILALGGPAPARAVEARLEGTWSLEQRVVVQGDNFLDPVGSTFTFEVTFTPTCAEGPCDVIASSDAFMLGREIRFVRQADRYVGEQLGDMECSNDVEVPTVLVMEVTPTAVDGSGTATVLEGTMRRWPLSYSRNPETGTCRDIRVGSPTSLSLESIDGPSGGPGGGPATGAADARGSIGGRSHVKRSAFASAIAAPDEVPWDVEAVARAALLALILTILVVFPAELFNSTYDANSERINAWWRRRLRRRPRASDPRASDPRASEPRASDQPASEPAGPARGWPAFLSFTLVAALLYGAVDPTFGVDVASATLVAGLGASMVVLGVAGGLTTVWVARARGGRLVGPFVLPGSIGIAVVCVIASRLADFQPGYVYGLIAGFVVGVELSRSDEGRAAALGSATMVGLGVVAWLAWSSIRADAADPSAGVGLLVLDATLASLFAAGLGGAVFSLVPIRFLPGAKVFAWSKAAWAVVFTVSAFAYVQLLTSPAAAETDSPAGTVVALFVAFGVSSIAFWAYFRYRRAPSVGQLGE